MCTRRFASLLAMTSLVLAACGGAATTAPVAMSSAVPTDSPTPAASALATASAAPTLATAPAATASGRPTQPLGDARQIHTATLLADGSVLIAGGYDRADEPLATATRFDPVAGVFSAVGSMADRRGSHTATLLRGGLVLVAGGGDASFTGKPATFLAAAELYDPRTGTFAATGPMSTVRESHTATLLPDGRVLIAGGEDAVDHALSTAELYDPKTGTFSPTGSMAVARVFHTATLLSDGRVLIAGGTSSATQNWSYSSPFLASAEIYNPKTGTFSPTGTMATPRGWHTATRLADGRVLVAGGERADEDLASAEIYNPKTGRWTATGSMAVGRVFHAATALSDGNVLAVGGGNYSSVGFLASAELYHPRSGTWTPTGSMATERNSETATLLADGRVLVAGGWGANELHASAELYDPKTGAFSPAGP
jgi:hypothetical protein